MSSRKLRTVYERLLRHRGHAGWWPGGSAFEVCVGAILVQNTAWTGAARALDALRERGWLTYEALAARSADEIAPVIRASGTFRVKARRLRAFLDFLGREYGGRVERMATGPVDILRAKLLAVPGIGPETADAIVLYAAGLPSFVVDAYTRRVFTRMGLLRGDETYDEIRGLFMKALPHEAPLFNDYHAQVVLLAKRHCRTKPLCEGCPVEDLCARSGLDAGGMGPMRVGSHRHRGERQA